MFGTIMADKKTLDKADRERYKAHYCGLCLQLDKFFGNLGCASLSYDMTFLCILLGSVYSLDETKGGRRCLAQPFVNHPYTITEAAEYSADINFFLSYYKCIDDWNDDGSRAALNKSRKMEAFLPGIKERRPRQCGVIEAELKILGEMEKNNELNPDLPANCLGKMLGEIFVWKEDENSEHLFTMGAAMGRFIYLMDAVNDLRSDLKKQRYNPLVPQTDISFTQMLTVIIAECTAAFEKLPLSRDQKILQNVLYSGVWQKFRLRNREEDEAVK